MQELAKRISFIVRQKTIAKQNQDYADIKLK